MLVAARFMTTMAPCSASVTLQEDADSPWSSSSRPHVTYTAMRCMHPPQMLSRLLLQDFDRVVGLIECTIIADCTFFESLKGYYQSLLFLSTTALASRAKCLAHQTPRALNASRAKCLARQTHRHQGL
jgi:hypothetical protein